MENKNLTEINEDLLNAINKELDKEYQRGIISVTELEEKTKQVEIIRKDEQAKINLSKIFNKDLHEYQKGLKKYNENFAETFLKKFLENKEDLGR
ncbi:MAG: hypothetical protein OSJ66_05275 [Clostridia bacterium]|nr:hypothetical protein [Clostridia bacterium]